MNYGAVKKTDIANGTGVRVSLFVSGCTHHCKNCFNRETWDFDYGSPFTLETEAEIIGLLEPDYINGLSLLGGEPMEPANQKTLLPFIRKVREQYPHKDIWCYTGYTFETDLLDGRAHTEDTDELLSLIDVLVDGEYIEAEKNITLKFRGSENQRIIDVKRSLSEGATVVLSL